MNRALSRCIDKRGTSYNLVNDSIYRKIKDLGVNLICFTSADYQDVSQRQTVIDNLKLAEKYGIDFYVTDSILQKELTDVQLAVRLAEYAQYDSFKGVFVVDEPFTEGYTSHDSESNTSWKNGIRRLEDYTAQLKMLNSYSNLSGYMNLNPMNTSLNKTGLSLEQAYSNYVKSCLATDIKMLSWDYYVWDQYISTGTTTKDYFKNLTMMSNQAKQAKISFWSYIQAGSNWNNDEKTDMPETNNEHPTEAELLWNVNTNLAYGAKGIQYFPLIQPAYFAYSENDTYDYKRNGLIGANGETTDWYDYAAKANKQIALVDEYLMRANMIDVLATATGNAQNDTAINHDSYEGISIQGQNGAIAGVFDYFGKRAVYLVNYDTRNEGADQVTINFASSQKYEVIGSNEQLIDGIGSGEGNSCTVTLANGGAALVLLR